MLSLKFEGLCGSTKVVCPSSAWPIFLYVTANFLLANGAPTRQIATAPAMKHQKVLKILFPSMITKQCRGTLSESVGGGFHSRLFYVLSNIY